MNTGRQIYFFANLGDCKKLPLGGGEVGNRRTLKLLKQLNANVIVIPKYLHEESHSFFRSFKLISKVTANISKFFFVLLMGQRKNSFVHIAGFYGNMVYFEFLLVGIARLLGYKVIYEMRAGGANLKYQHNRKIYRNTFYRLIKLSNIIFSQGKENYPLIYSIDKEKSIFYYPNYVLSDFYPIRYPQKPKDEINLIYFGRISKAKHVNVVIDTYLSLAKLYANVNLEIIGNTEDEQYSTEIKQKITNEKMNIRLYPACTHEELKSHLRDKHFFIFPTTEPGEGHSNALTEAMAWGIIPIASSHGFNQSVIDNKALIIDNLDSSEFVKVISKILQNRLVETYSKQVHQRVIDHFTDRIVLSHLKEEYEYLYASFFG